MQIRDDLRKAFLSWRDAGNLAALTTVFDRVAQELLLVASHVATAGQQPEDLLQETFLTAIQKADRYDGIRPLEPWLVGILVNVARNGRRKLRREPTGVDLVDGVTLDDPAAAAAAAELLDGVREAIVGLPVPQREVMTLYLVHGMTPTEIAHATSRPVGTVKSWIHRSLDHVRRQLPIGLTAAFGTLLRGMTRLADVRAAVLAAAGATTGVATGLGELGGLGGPVGAPARTFRVWPWLVGSVAAVLGGTWMMLPQNGEPVPRVLAAATATQVPVPTVVSAAAQTTPVTVEPPRAEGSPAATAPPTCLLTIVGKPEGEPYPFHGYLLTPGQCDADLQRVPFLAGDRGYYTIRGVPFGDYLLQIDRAEGQMITIDRPEQTIEVPIARGLEVHGHVVDAHGHGVGDASVWLTSANTVEDRHQVATSDPTGRFVVRDVPAGRFLTAELPGSLPSRFVAVTAPTNAGPLELELRLDQPATTVAFEVVDPAGAPIADARVQLGHCLPRPRTAAAKITELRPPWLGRTDDAGRVRCATAPVGATATVFARAAVTAAVERSFVVEPDGAPVRLVLPRGGRVRGTVDEPGGEERVVIARALGEGVTAGPTTPLWCLPSCMTSGRGNYLLVGVPAGPTRVRLDSDGRIAERTFDVHDGEEIEWSPRLTADGELRGRVDGVDAATANGLRVQLRGTGMRAIDADLASDGTFHVASVPARDLELVLLPRDRTADLVLQHRYPVRAGDEVRLTLLPDLAATASVCGVVPDPDLRQLSLSSVRGTCVLGADAAGRFQFAPLPPGVYHLVAGRTRVRWHRELRLEAHATVDLGPITREPTTPVTISFDGASERAPVDVHVRSTDGVLMVSFARHRGQPLPLELPLGRWQVELYQQGVCIAAQPIVVTEQPLAVPLQPVRGERVWLTARPAMPTLALPVHWEIVGPAGRQHFFSYRPDDFAAHRSAGLELVLAPGDYEAFASSRGGPAASMRFSVPGIPDRALPPMLVH